jgi:hypothetical protein
MATRLEVRNRPNNQHLSIGDPRPWTSKELEELRRFASLGAESAAEQLDRTVGSVKWQAHKLRISLRRPGVRSGRVLGELRGEVLDPELRAGVLEGRVDMVRIEQLARARASGTSWCPRCTRRPIEVAVTGLCRNCHLLERAEGHRDELALQEAQRTLDRERQRKHRRRRAASNGKAS